MTIRPLYLVEEDGDCFVLFIGSTWTFTQKIYLGFELVVATKNKKFDDIIFGL